MEKKLIQIIKNLGIQELEGLETLNLLDGNYLNLECILPNGKTGKILDTQKRIMPVRFTWKRRISATVLRQTTLC